MAICSTRQAPIQQSKVLGLYISLRFIQSVSFSSFLPFCCTGHALSVLSLASVVLKYSFKVSVCSEMASSYPFLWQVHVHRDLHIWITSENHRKRFLHRWLYLSAGSMELARFQCHHDGVSSLLTLLMFWVWLRVGGFTPGCVCMTVCISVSFWVQCMKN